jgi:hypothetical protein
MCRRSRLIRIRAVEATKTSCFCWAPVFRSFTLIRVEGRVLAFSRSRLEEHFHHHHHGFVRGTFVLMATNTLLESRDLRLC